MTQYFAMEFSSGDVLSVEQTPADRIVVRCQEAATVRPNAMMRLTNSELQQLIAKLQEIGPKQ